MDFLANEYPVAASSIAMTGRARGGTRQDSTHQQPKEYIDLFAAQLNAVVEP